MNLRRHNRLATIGAGLSAVLVIVASACGTQSDLEKNGGKGSTLTIQGDVGSPSLVDNFNPLLTTSLHGSVLIYEPLDIRSPIDGTYTPVLATGFSFTNPKTLVYAIRSNVKWSDGRALTPADVVFTYNLLKRFPALDSSDVWSQISTVTSSDDEVTFTFNTANVPFAGVLSNVPIVPEHLWSSIKDPTKYANTRPVGTGPYTLQSYAPTKYMLQKNTNYWQASKIVPLHVAFPGQPPDQHTIRLRVTNGDFDWSYQFLPDVQKTYVGKSTSHVYWYPPRDAIGLFLNLTWAPYSDQNFRRGISLALNRTSIAAKAVNGYLTQASQSGLILPNLKRWLDPDIPHQGNVAPSKSAALAAFGKAGYTTNGGKLQKDGDPVTMTIVVPNSYADWVAAAKEIGSELGAVGIKVTLNLPQIAQYTEEVQSGTFDATLAGFGGTGDPATDFNNVLNSRFAAPVETATAKNFERFKSPLADQALATLAATTDKQAQLRATYQLEQIMYQQTPIVMLYYGGSWGVFSTKKFRGWPSAKDPYALPASYNNMMLIVLTHLTAA